MTPSASLRHRLFVLFLALFVLVSCSEDTPLEPEPIDDNGGGPPPNTPAIPLPSSPTDILPEQSDSLVFEAALIQDFSPTLAAAPDTLVRLLADAGLPLVTVRPANMRFNLVIDGVLSDPVTIPYRACTSGGGVCIEGARAIPGLVEVPTVQHIRYWQKVFSSVVEYPFNYQESHTYTEGTSETTGETFSYTLGVSAGAWGIGLSAALTRTFSHSITVSSETSVTKEYTCNSINGKTIVFTAWQLIEGYRICNADSSGYTDPEYDCIIPLIDNASNNLYLSTVVFSN